MVKKNKYLEKCVLDSLSTRNANDATIITTKILKIRYLYESTDIVRQLEKK